MGAHKRKQILNYEEFLERIKKVKSATSLQGGVNYNVITPTPYTKIYGIRESTKQAFCIDIKKLFEAHKDLDFINTTLLKDKKYVPNRAQSPALAILKEIGVI